MKVHKVKIYESYADAVLSGEKTFEIRNNDRGYQKGDHLRFEVKDDRGTHGILTHGLNDKEYEITYVHSGLGVAAGYVVLAIKAVKVGKSVINNHVITEEEIAIEKLNRALNDYLQDQETASQMEEAITYAVKILAGIVEEEKE